MATHNEFGKQGENLAINYLKNRGYTILEKNWRYRKAEIDIIAKLQNEIIIIEVKSRSSDYFGNPQEFIDHKKIKLLVEAANHYVILNDLDIEVRFDIVAILRKKGKLDIEHFENAFLHF